VHVCSLHATLLTAVAVASVWQGYAPLFSDFDSFYTRRLYTRIRDCWNRPITGVPGRTITVLERESSDYNVSFKLTGTQKTMINFASYNYLGFAQNEGPCADAVEVRRRGGRNAGAVLTRKTLTVLALCAGCGGSCR
jgi:7-keto-8-aminopelargonate synthetase-like enzyme